MYDMHESKALQVLNVLCVIWQKIYIILWVLKRAKSLFSRYEAHYAVPLGRKKTAKTVNIRY